MGGHLRCVIPVPDSSVGRSLVVGSNDVAQKIADQIGVTLVTTAVVTSEDEAVRCAREIGWPLVMKIDLPAVAHRSDIGGVRVGIFDEAGVRDAFQSLFHLCRRIDPDATAGVLVQRMERTGIELILAARLDEVFGPIVMFGSGGVLVEQLRQATFGLLPMTAAEARLMCGRSGNRHLFESYRGMPGADEQLLADAIAGLSAIVSEDSAVAEVEFNPILATEQGLVAVDWRVLLSPDHDRAGAAVKEQDN
jgi:succinyl-CoA synthetase beta subunit